MNLGLGVQNLMMAYHDIVPDSDSDQSSEDSPMQEDASPIGNREKDMEFFHFNEVPAEVAHLQIGMVETFFSFRRTKINSLKKVSNCGINTLLHIFRGPQGIICIRY
jgi:hypothetical protein